MTLDQLCALVVQALRGDADLGAQIQPWLQHMTADDQQDPVLRRFFTVLVDILAGSDSPDLSDLPPELTDAVDDVLAALADQRSD